MVSTSEWKPINLNMSKMPVIMMEAAIFSLVNSIELFLNDIMKSFKLPNSNIDFSVHV